MWGSHMQIFVSRKTKHGKCTVEGLTCTLGRAWEAGGREDWGWRSQASSAGKQDARQDDLLERLEFFGSAGPEFSNNEPKRQET